MSMKKVPAKNHSRHQKSDSVNFDKNFHPTKLFPIKNFNVSSLSLNTLATSATNYLDTGTESITQKQPNDSGSVNYKDQYYKVWHEIKQTLIDIKNRTIKEDPTCASTLKRHIFLEQGDEELKKLDPIILLHYIKKLYEKMLDLKSQAESELNTRKDNDCNDYEGMLQKLEAEVRQHIRVEQQLRLYIETAQAKIDEYEKVYSPVDIESRNKAIEDLKHQNSTILEKLRRRDSEIEHLKRDIKRKNKLIKELELKAEDTAALRNKIRELEKFNQQNGHNSFKNNNILKESNVNNREMGNEKNSSFTKHFQTSDTKPRKPSHSGNEILKQRLMERDKENIETFKLDLSKYMQENSVGYKDNHNQSDIISNGNQSRHAKVSVQKEEKVCDFSTVIDKMKKTIRSSQSRNTSKETLRSFDQTLNLEEVSEAEDKISGSHNNKEDGLNLIKINHNKKINFNIYLERIDRKLLEKTDSKLDTKPNKSQVNSYKENMDISNVKNSISKISQMSLKKENQHNENQKKRKDIEFYNVNVFKDLSKLLKNSPKKVVQSRSQSVDTKHRLHKQSKVNHEK